MALIRLTSVWVGTAGSPYYTQSYFLGAGDATHASAAVSAMFALLASCAPGIDDALTINISGDLEVVDPFTGQISSVVSVGGANQAGTGTGDALPTLVQGLLQLNTGTYLNGRQLKGHMYLPGMLESNNTVVGQPAAGYRGTVNTALATYIASSADPAVYSRTHLAASSIQSASMSSQWSYLRSRRD